MTYQQKKLLEWLEQAVATFDLHGYTDLARTAAEVIEHLNKGETVWAVLVASSGMGPEFVERLRRTFGVGRVE